ncbi:DPP IV N-terminal domain-containing protein [Candidatus Leptofilum sp.]|uniref:DPP IV N-terminal domain-containing protein n=1 Tax=Candidatus Leptofilum sp. TaxID=3241576 RepID=UPI003B5CD8E1
MKRVLWLLVALFLLGCGRTARPTAVPTPAPTAAADAAAEVVPTATAVPPQPTDIPLPATIPPTPMPPTPEPEPPTATPVPLTPDVPDLVWLPYGSGNFGQPVLMLEEGEVAPQPLPVEVEIFFGYDKGWLAYGGTFWEPTANQQSVTNLHLYNFASGEDEIWAEQVGRAAATPLTMMDGPPSVAVAIHNGQSFDLVLMRGPENQTVLVEDIEPYFSWSPDGTQIAYLRDNNLFITDAAGDSGNAHVANGVYASSGWIGDAPLWLGDSGYLLYADAPFGIVAADGSETIVPTTNNGEPLPPVRPFTMLYSQTTNQLIAESEGMFGPSVTIYQFGDAFGTAEIIQQFDDAQLAGWYEADESVILVTGGEPIILPLTPQN